MSREGEARSEAERSQAARSAAAEPRQAADKALAAFQRLLSGAEPWQRGDRALTLQMLKGLAPAFFARHALQADFDRALEALGGVKTGFGPKVELDEAMSRLDALHLRKLHRLKLAPFDRDELARYIDRTEQEHGLLPAWLMGEQARILGVKAQRSLPARFPFLHTHRLAHLYFVTHILMIDTDYFHRRAEPSRYGEELLQLERAVPWLVDKQQWDLLGEVELCLCACNRSSQAAQQALAQAQQPDGSFKEEGAETRQMGHTTAACLIALAAAVNPAP